MSYATALALLQNTCAAVSGDGYSVGFWSVDTADTANLRRGDAEMKRYYRGKLAGADLAAVPPDGNNGATCHVAIEATHVETGTAVVLWVTSTAALGANATAVRAWMTALVATCKARIGAG